MLPEVRMARVSGAMSYVLAAPLARLVRALLPEAAHG